jgi:enoyl-CoA hydratase/carnithine racemase
LRTVREGRLLRLALDRPDKRNALSAALCRDLADGFEQAAADPAIGAILLDADGPVFCAGMDLDESVAEDAARLTAIHESIFTAGATLEKPLIAAVQGAALGGGVGLVANAHIAVASEASTFALPEIRIGMWPFVIWRSIVAAMGERRALELALTGRTFPAEEALEYGLVHRVVPAGEVGAAAWEIAAQAAEASPQTVARGLELARRTSQLDLRQAGELALSLRAETLSSADFHEGVRAFREKRRPRWPSLGAFV